MVKFLDERLVVVAASQDFLIITIWQW